MLLAANTPGTIRCNPESPTSQSSLPRTTKNDSMNVGAEEESNNKIVSFVTKWSGSISHLFAVQKRLGGPFGSQPVRKSAEWHVGFSLNSNALL